MDLVSAVAAGEGQGRADAFHVRTFFRLIEERACEVWSSVRAAITLSFGVNPESHTVNARPVQQPSSFEQLHASLLQAISELTQHGQVQTVRCHVCTEPLHVVALSKQAWHVACSCKFWNGTVR